MTELDLTLGGIYIGTILNVTLFGVLLMQAMDYLRNCQRDPRWMRLYVAVVFFTEVLNSGFVSASTYNYLITASGNPEKAASINWVFSTDPALTGIIATIVQWFFAYRVYRLTSNRWITGLIVVCSTIQGLCAIGAAIGAGIVGQLPQLQRIRVVASLWLGFAGFTDILITINLSWALHKSKTGFAKTDDTISRIIRATVQTGLLTTIVATADLILFLTSSSNLHLIANFMLGKLYTNSLLSSLNARKLHEESFSRENSRVEASRDRRASWMTNDDMQRRYSTRLSVAVSTVVHQDGGDAESSSEASTEVSEKTTAVSFSIPSTLNSKPSSLEDLESQKPSHVASASI